MLLVIVSFFLVLAWPNELAAASIHHPSSRTRKNGVRQRIMARHVAKPNLNRGSCRQLSAEEQLDILRLGFIPTSRSEDDVTHFSGRGGGMDVNDSSAKPTTQTQRTCRRQLSATDQLDILKLGFIPTSPKSQDDESKPNAMMSRFLSIRGGGVDVSNNRAHYGAKSVTKCSRELSAADQLDILQLGFIPASRDEEPRSFLSTPKNAMTHFKSRGGSMDAVSNEPQHTLPPLAFASIMAFLAGYSDVICIKKFHAYAAMMSGNIVTLSIALSEQKWQTAMWRASLIGSYFVGAISVRSIELVCNQRWVGSDNKSRRYHLKIIAPIVAVVFAIAEKAIGSSTITSDGHISNMFVLALGYGMVYASANQALGGTITQLLTGHVTKLGSAIADRFLGSSRQWNKGIETSACILGSFVIGGVFGGRILQKEFPIFALLGLVYAIVLALF